MSSNSTTAFEMMAVVELDDILLMAAAT